jgi:hypothetical protein
MNAADENVVASLFFDARRMAPLARPVTPGVADLVPSLPSLACRSSLHVVSQLVSPELDRPADNRADEVARTGDR